MRDATPPGGTEVTFCGVRTRRRYVERAVGVPFILAFTVLPAWYANVVLVPRCPWRTFATVVWLIGHAGAAGAVCSLGWLLFADIRLRGDVAPADGLSPCRVPGCGVLRPLGSHHCRACDACVAGFDHHCDVLGVCIGRGNHKAFITLLASGAAGLWCVFSGALVTAWFDESVRWPAIPWFLPTWSFDDARAFGWRYAFGLLACPWFGGPLLGVCVMQTARHNLWLCCQCFLTELQYKVARQAAEAPAAADPGAPCASLREFLRGAHDLGDFGEARRRLDDGGCVATAGRIFESSPLLRSVVFTVLVAQQLAYAFAYHLAVTLSCIYAAIAIALNVAFNYGWLRNKTPAPAPTGVSLPDDVCRYCTPPAPPTPEVQELLEGAVDARWCAPCGHVRRPFEEHCPICRVCVAGRDHHCGLLGQCIGDHNRAQFVALLVVGIAGTLNQCVHALRWALVVALPAGVAAAGDGDVVEVVKVVFPALFWSYAYVSPLAGCALFLWQQTTFLLHQRGVLSWHLS